MSKTLSTLTVISKQAALYLLMMVLIVIAVDYWRKPATANESKAVLAQLYAVTDTEQTLMVYIWGSWCSICRFSSPIINQLSQDDYPVLSLAVASGGQQQVAQYLSDNGWQFSTEIDETGILMQTLGVHVTPTILYINADGEVCANTSGMSTAWGLKLRYRIANLWC